MQLNDKYISVEKEKVTHLYKNTDDKGKKLISNLFPDLKEYIPVTNRIKTFIDAYTELKHTHPYVKQFDELLQPGLLSENHVNDLLAYMKLRIICTALNEGWEIDFENAEKTREWYYIPYLTVNTWKEIETYQESCKAKQFPKEPVLKLDEYGKEKVFYQMKYRINPDFILSEINFPLYLKNEELAVYCGRQFIDIWAEFYLPDYITSKLVKIFI